MSSISSIVNTRRIDRVLPWIGAAVLAAGVATFLVVYFGRDDSSSPAPAQQQASEQQVSQKAAATIPVPNAARGVAVQFIGSAVARKHLASSYELTTPNVRQGLTLKQWQTGNIPVLFYPTTQQTIAHAKVTTEWSHPLDIQLYYVLSPPKGSGQSAPLHLLIGLVKRSGQWKVDYVGPKEGIPVPTDAGG